MLWLLALPGALVVGFSMGLFGSGGSILTVPILVYLLGWEEKVAIASSLAIVWLVAFITSLRNLREGTIDWAAVLWFGLPGVLGTYVGAYVSQYFPGWVQMAVFAVVMAIASVFMIRPLPEGRVAAPQHGKGWVMIEGLLVGALTGFVGVGGGFVIVPALMILGGLSMMSAAASSLVIIAVKSAAGFIGYQQILVAKGQSLDWAVIACFVVFGALGSWYGSVYAEGADQVRLQQWFGGGLILMATWILWRTLLTS